MGAIDPDESSFTSMDDDDPGMETPTMEETDFSSEEDVIEKQWATTKTYIDSVPYQCETAEEMQAKLETIMGRIMVCARSKNWALLADWNYLLLR
jgi:proteasome activator subunit 4